MATTTFITAQEIVNRAAAECGIGPVQDVYGSADQKIQQMRYLLDTAGEELSIAHPWEWLVKGAVINETTTRDGAGFEIPADYYYLVPQTTWEPDKRLPMGGPLTAQEWTYLIGRDTAASTLFTSFRLFGGLFNLYPEPPLPPETFTFTYEYIRNTWVTDADDPNEQKQTPTKNDDIVQFDKTLITRYVKLKYYESIGADTTKAQADVNQVFEFLTGKDKSGKVLNAGGNHVGSFAYLGDNNVPFTNYGLP